MQYQQMNQYGFEQNENIAVQNNGKKGLYGFKASAFPLVGAIVATFTILATYFVARDKSPPDVPPFPQTDITHTAIKYPEYVIFRIGLMVAPVLFCISFQILKNYLTIQSFEIKGQADQRLNKFGYLSILSCLLLCLSTSTISDGKDMDWTSHTIGATGFFIVSMYMCLVSAKIYRQLYVVKQFCSSGSYQIKKYTNFIVLFFLILQVLDMLKMVDIGSLVQWGLTFYLIIYIFTLFYDFKNLDMMLIRTK